MSVTCAAVTRPVRSRANSVNFVPSHTVFITGPRVAAKVRWLQETIHEIRAGHSSARCAILSAESGIADLERFARVVPGVTVRRFVLPCFCCPAAAELPRHARTLAEDSRADWLFIDLPVLAAGSLIAEFDALVRWPCEFVLCVDADWGKACHAGTLSFAQIALTDMADRVVMAAPAPS